MTGKWEQALGEWLGHLRAAGRPQTTLALRGYHVRRFARESGIGDPWAVRGADLVAWFGVQDWARDTRRSVRSSCRSFWGWAVTEGKIATNPADALGVVRASEPMPRPTPDAAYRRALLQAGDRETVMLRLAAEVGLRRGEVARVHARDLREDLLGWSLLVHGKGDKRRVVPLPDDLARLLSRQADGGWAFPGDVDGHLSPAWVGKLVSRLLPEGWAMHSLRHRFATRAYGVDRDLLTVQALLGHTSPETTQRYVRPPADAARRTVLLAANG